ncbi:hypothetical protein UB45_01790 [Terrabacter sp. 28]|nr:hypothetical protein UB45_01790 [Terrabacter sp. 28]
MTLLALLVEALPNTATCVCPLAGMLMQLLGVLQALVSVVATSFMSGTPDTASPVTLTETGVLKVLTKFTNST